MQTCTKPSPTFIMIVVLSSVVDLLPLDFFVTVFVNKVKAIRKGVHLLAYKLIGVDRLCCQVK